MSTVQLHEHGRIRVTVDVDGVGTLHEELYPLCNDAVQTVVEDGERVVHVRPDTYLRRAT